MAGANKLVTAGGGGVVLTPASSIASDVTLSIPSIDGTLIAADASGKVGVGIVSPVDQLHVNTASTGGIRITNGVTGATGSDGLWLGIDSSGQSYMYNSENTAIAFYTNNTQQMRIEADGTIKGANSNMMLVQGTVVTSTSGTAIGFTGIPSWAKRVTLVLQRVTTSSTAQWIVQVGSGSYATSGYESASQTTYSGSGATISQTTGMAIFHNAAATYISGTMTFTNVNGNTWVQDHTTSYSVGGSNQGGGYTSLGGALDRIQITTVGGANTFTGGAINIFYE